MSNDSSPPGADPHATAAHLRRAVGDLVRAGRARDGLPPVPAAVMDLLDRNGPMTTSDLAAIRRVRHQTMAATVKELVQAGHVAAVADPADGRKKVLDLTPAGQDALDGDREARLGRLADAMARCLDEHEVRELSAALGLVDRITAALGDAVPLRPRSQQATRSAPPPRPR
ncbi:MarR family winged helix-turn-helix transcriptional regulator [Myceligenerans indicum]|uniref:MarR family transcriptional regulator n=1 Tax=Myceligenerans indicum TaxID=2593663 RepID=A0ABS1LJD1_9MICO|nr:MarR family transcriptional regulator [Myceligenerans indicum]MBL0885933.1 MarR family transcriptional regulator [Myceligenerans indicum]